METTWLDIMVFIQALTPEQQNLPAVCYHDVNEDYENVDCIKNDEADGVIPIAFLMFADNSDENPCSNANWVRECPTYTSRIRCHYDSKKNIVSHTQVASLSDLGNCTSEYLELDAGKVIQIDELDVSPFG